MATTVQNFLYGRSLKSRLLVPILAGTFSTCFGYAVAVITHGRHSLLETAAGFVLATGLCGVFKEVIDWSCLRLRKGE